LLDDGALDQMTGGIVTDGHVIVSDDNRVLPSDPATGLAQLQALPGLQPTGTVAA
jgi:hypothetical protein